MKRLLFSLIYFLSCLSVFAADYSFFKYATYSSGDYFTGQNYFNLEQFYVLKHGNKINQIKDNYTENNEKYYYCSIYNESGQIIKFETDYHDGESIFFNYNKDNYLTVFGHGDSKFEYPKENQRNCYFKNKFQYRQTIEIKDNIYTVIRERLNPKTDSLFIDDVSTYIYSGKKIQSYQTTSYNYLEKISTIVTFDFEYDSNRNIRKINIKGSNQHNGNETWNTEALFEYDDAFNLIKIIKNDKIKPQENTVSEFSNYDDFGNWHNFKMTRGNKICEEIVREITYR